MGESTRASEVLDIVRGGYDLHVHTIPSHFPRSLDDFELARQCDTCGLAGAMIKSHYEPTASRAELANRYSGAQARLVGGVALNWPVGGINPFAVESTLKLGGRIVWMPTRDSENCLRFGNMNGDFFSRPPVQIHGEDGKLLPAFFEVLEVIKKYGAWLATGHLSPAESVEVCKAARQQGVNTILTHPDWVRTVVPLDIQLELADAGVLVEKVWLNITKGYVTAQAMAESLQKLGGDRVYLVTDLGQKNGQRPVDGLQDFVACMLEQGISGSELRKMVCDTPSRIAGF